MDICFSAAASFGVVLSFYAWRKPRQAFIDACRDLWHAAETHDGPSPCFRRDDKIEIIKRSVSFGSAAFILVCLTGAPLRRSSSTTANAVLHSECTLVVKIIISISALWIGPLLECPSSFVADMVEHARDRVHEPWNALRELLVAPLAEEIVFRGVIHHLLRRRPLTVRIGIAGTLFAAAHLHLVVNMAVEECSRLKQQQQQQNSSVATSAPREPWAADIVERAKDTARRRMAGHLILVAAYGWLNGWLFEQVCDKSVIAATVAHSICNFVGAPAFKFLSHGRDEEYDGWTKARRVFGCVMYITGVATFVAVVRRL